MHCPRCLKDRPSHWFRPPIAICVSCYAGIPANEGLTTEQLFKKMTVSRYAKRRVKPATHAARMEKELGMVERDWVKGLATQQEDEGPALAPCTNCRAMFPAEELNERRECRECGVEDPNGAVS